MVCFMLEIMSTIDILVESDYLEVINLLIYLVFSLTKEAKVEGGKLRDVSFSHDCFGMYKTSQD